MSQVITSSAPARVCLFGDHQDYLGLPIIACAIDRYINIKGVKTDNDFFHINLKDLDRSEKIFFGDIDQSTKTTNHLVSVIKVLKHYGCRPNYGLDVEINGTIPINAGLSSSSAVVVAWVRFLIKIFGIDQKATPELIARIAYESEVLEMNGSGGKMDQYSIALGGVIYLETDETSNFEKLKLSRSISLVVGESGVPKATHAVLKELKTNTWQAIDYVNSNVAEFYLKSILVNDLDKLVGYVPQRLQTYFSAAILNHNVTQNALTEFKRDNLNLKEIGRLMDEHHLILKEKLSLTVPRIDAMIDAAKGAGALGAKIVGSGKGGSMVALSQQGNEQAIITALRKAGAQDAYKVKIVEY